MTLERMLPLYQGMMTSFYDHRAADVVRSDSATQRQNQPRYLTDEEKAGPMRLPMPQYWVRESLLDPDLPEWLIGFSDITSSTNERTLVVVSIPRSGVGNTLPIILSAESVHRHCLLACLCSFVVDFQARQKIGGTHLNFFYLRQVPILPPARFDEPCTWDIECSVSEWVAHRVAELVATASDMVVVAEQLGIKGAPFRWDAERRTILRSELDAAFFHLYGLTRDETDYVMDTFPIVRRNDEKEYGEFRSKRLILEIYDELADAMSAGKPYRTRLDPPPAGMN